MNGIGVFGVGRVATDPTPRYNEGGKCRTQFRVAVKTFNNGQEGADFYTVRVINHSEAEQVGNHLVKGQRVAFKGVARYEEWQKEGEAQPRRDLVIIPDIGGLEFLDRPNGEGNKPKENGGNGGNGNGQRQGQGQGSGQSTSGGQGAGSGQRPAQGAGNQNKPNGGGGNLGFGGNPFPDEEIPF